MTTTPFVYADALEQDRNERGHAAQYAFFEAASKPEGSLGGIEHKQDDMRDIKGNWFVEVFGSAASNYPPSGISTSGAAFWLFRSARRHSLFVDTEDLRAYLDYKYPGWRVSAWYAGCFATTGTSGSRGLLVKQAEFDSWLDSRK